MQRLRAHKRHRTDDEVIDTFKAQEATAGEHEKATLEALYAMHVAGAVPAQPEEIEAEMRDAGVSGQMLRMSVMSSLFVLWGVGVVERDDESGGWVLEAQALALHERGWTPLLGADRRAREFSEARARLKRTAGLARQVERQEQSASSESCCVADE